MSPRTDPARRGRRRLGGSLARRLLVVQSALVLVALTAAVAVLAVDALDTERDRAAERTEATAQVVAHSPLVQAALAEPDDEATAALQPYSLVVDADTAVDFITIMRPDGTRLTHPDETQIGGRYLGSTAAALAGRAETETYTGTLGPSVRTIVPVLDGEGDVVGLAAAGVTLSSVDEGVRSRLVVLAGLAVALLALAAVASVGVGRYLSRVTAGRGPEELARIFVSYESALHAVREGLALADGDGRLVLVNDHAADLLGVAAADAPLPVAATSWPAELHPLLVGDEERRDEIVVVGGRVLVVNHALADRSPGAAGPVTVTTLRDRTELQRVSGELESSRTLADAMRAQTHEHANRLHTIASLLELGRVEEARGFASREVGLAQRLVDRVAAPGEEPVIAALMLGKTAQADGRGVALRFETHLEPGTQGLDPADVVTVLGNLVDNAVDAAASAPAPDGGRWVEVYLAIDETGELIVQVSDSGGGVPEGDLGRVFERGFSTKAHDGAGRGIGLALVEQTAARLGGAVDVAGGPAGAVFTVTLPLTPAEARP